MITSEVFLARQEVSAVKEEKRGPRGAAAPGVR